MDTERAHTRTGQAKAAHDPFGIVREQNHFVPALLQSRDEIEGKKPALDHDCDFHASLLSIDGSMVVRINPARHGGAIAKHQAGSQTGNRLSEDHIDNIFAGRGFEGATSQCPRCSAIRSMAASRSR